jgi:hypothetical protein
MREIVYQRKLRNREASVKATRDRIPGRRSSLRSLHHGKMVYRLKAVKLMRLDLWSQSTNFAGLAVLSNTYQNLGSLRFKRNYSVPAAQLVYGDYILYKILGQCLSSRVVRRSIAIEIVYSPSPGCPERRKHARRIEVPSLAVPVCPPCFPPTGDGPRVYLRRLTGNCRKQTFL